LNNPALDRILDFCAETGLLVILHNDINMPFPKSGQENWEVDQIRQLFKRHPKTTIIWAHCGVGRIVRPVKDQMILIGNALSNPNSTTSILIYHGQKWQNILQKHQKLRPTPLQ
jgi:predicted TIM-barrel fold metal-dependent hydrolase